MKRRDFLKSVTVAAPGVVESNTVRIDFAKKERLTIPDFAVIVSCVINSELHDGRWFA